MLGFFKSKHHSFGGLDLAALVAGLAVFVSASLATIANSSIWFDEAFGAYMIRFGYGDIVRYTASDVHPPLYYWALKAWSSVFGYNEFALRSLSVMFGAIAIIFAFLLIRRYFGRRVGGMSLLFMAITPFFVRYSQEMRMYTMVAAIAFAATYIFVIAREKNKRWQWVVYGVLVGLGMLTQYFAALIWLTHWLWRFIDMRMLGVRGKQLARSFFSGNWIMAHVLALIVFALWIGPFLHQILDVQVNGFWIPPVTPSTPLNFLTNVYYYLQQDNVTGWGTLVFALFIIGLVASTGYLLRVLPKTQKRYYLLIVLLGTIPPLLLILLSLPPLRPAFVERYVTPSSLMLGALVGVNLALLYFRLSSKLRLIVFVGLLAIFAYGLSNVYRLGNYNNTLHQSNNTRQVMEAVWSRAAPGEPIVIDSPWLYFEAAFYSRTDHPVYFVDANTQYIYGSLDMLKDNDLGKIKDLSAFEVAHPTFWYVGRPGAPEESPPGPGLKTLSSIRMNDSVSGQPAYEAIELEATER